MKKDFLQVLGLSFFVGLLGCCGAVNPGVGPVEPVVEVSSEPEEEEKVSIQKTADTFLSEYFDEYASAELAQTVGYWKAANSGKKEDFEAFAKADLALRTMHSDTEKYAELNELLAHPEELSPVSLRSLQVALLAFKENQLPKEMLAKMVALSTEIEQMFSTFRGELDGEKLSNNQLLEKLAKEKKSKKREAAWGALKQVGEAVGAKLIELAKLRNEAAKTLGYANFWDMRVRLQEHDPEHVLAIFADLEKNTDEPFKKMKHKLDGELAKRFKIKANKMMPWHYDNPFFQSAPPSAKVDLDDFYKDKPKEEIPALALKFLADIGLPAEDIIERSDLYEREGKDQHAFCIAMDRKGDVRTLLNVKPKADSMNTMLHEEGHAVYYKFLDYDLPYNQREATHIFTTEGIAMLFGALAENPTWLVDYAGADAKAVEKQRAAILEQRQREQLVFARWTMVMLYFEKDMYENPDQDLNKLWWDYVERFQMITRPEGRDVADWASKPHFTIAPVYYHNYMLGELYAAQLRSALAKMANHTEANSSLSFVGRKDFGEFFINKVFKPGMTVPWPQFVKDSTGEELSCKHFAAEVQ